MIVYVDVLLCVNIFINFFLLLCVKNFLKIKSSLRRLSLAAAASSLFSLTVFLPRLPFFLSILLKALFGITVVLAAFGRASYKVFLKRVCAFMLVNFAFGGIMMAVWHFAEPAPLLIFNGVVYFDISPVMLIIITLICYFILRFVQKATGRQEAGGNYHTVKITAEGKSFTCLGKIDTGCTLKEPFSGAPVIVAERRIFSEDFSPDMRSCRIIPFESLGGSGIIRGFLPDALRLDDRVINQKVYVGISDKKFNGEFQALINAEVLE